MPEYAVTFARSARREIETLPARIVRRVITKIESLVQEPRPPVEPDQNEAARPGDEYAAKD